MLDDVGLDILACFGAGIGTPTVDSLAPEGLRFTNFHVTPRYSPSLVRPGNHGIVTGADTADRVDALAKMAHKGPRGRLQALADGGAVP